MPLSLFLALRHLRSPRRSRAVALTALVAAGGIFTGVLALTVILSVMNGMEAELAGLLGDGEAHLHLRPSGFEGLRDLDGLMAELEALPGVEAVAPYVESEVLLAHRRPGEEHRLQTATLLGVDPAREARVTRLLSPDFRGFEPDPDWVLPPGAEGAPGLVLGLELAQSLALGRGDLVTLVVPESGASGEDGDLSGRELDCVVVDLFDAGLYEINATRALGALAPMGAFLGMDGEAGALALRCADPADAGRLAESLRALPVAEGLEVETWQDRNALLFAAMAREKLLMYLFLILTVGVASLGIVGAMTLMVSEKRQEIGVLRTLGLSRRGILGMIVLEGWTVGLAGVILGLLAGWGFGAIIQRHPLPIPWDLFIVDTVPLLMNPVDFLRVGGLTLLLSLLATLYPGWEAARLDPIEAVRKA